jgi:hypothetical protein
MENKHEPTIMNNFEKEYYKLVDEVTHYMWDPIGVAGEPGARDEYHSYLPVLFKRLIDGKLEEASEYLDKIVVERMELKKNPNHSRSIVEILNQWKIALMEKYTK